MGYEEGIHETAADMPEIRRVDNASWTIARPLVPTMDRARTVQRDRVNEKRFTVTALFLRADQFNPGLPS